MNNKRFNRVFKSACKAGVLLLISIFLFRGSVFTEKKILKEDDIRDRGRDVGSYKTKTAEMLLNFFKFDGKEIIFRDVYGENVRVIIKYPKELNFKCVEYLNSNSRLISGKDFRFYGKMNPDITVKDILKKMSHKKIPVSVLMRFKIIEIERKEHKLNHNYDYIVIRGKPVFIVI